MSMQPSSSRSLAPAPQPLNGAIADSGASLPGATPNSLATGIKRARTACQSCKQIKRKCDQAQPCSNCRKSRTRCIYNEADDGRRKAARKRNVETLELKRDALDGILESFRSSDDHHVQHLVRLIRSHAPLDEIVDYANSNAHSLPGNQAQKITTAVSGQPRRTVLSVNDMCDTPLVRVPSKPWTSVTNDNEFISHLISLYFTWFHLAYPILDKELLLRDMSAGSLDCQFCSPLLVNAMLAIACQFSNHPRACRIPSDSGTRGRHFMDEAVKLWNEQESRPALTNIQALGILAVVSTLIGKDRMSMSYLQQMNMMLQELMLKNNHAESRGTLTISFEMRRAQNLSSWTAFLLTVGYDNAFMRPPTTITPPKIEPSSRPLLEKRSRWFPYPQQSPEVIVPCEELYQAQCRLHEIGDDIQRVRAVQDFSVRQQKVQLLGDRLQGWKHGLPEPLLQVEDLSPINPPIMDLHLTYHWFRIMLYNFITTPELKSASDTDYRVQNHGRDQTILAAKTIANLCKIFARDFGLKQPTMWMPQTALSAAHSLIDALSDPKQGALIQEVFHELCLVLVAASQRWLVMKGHVRMLFLTAEERGQKLPEHTKDLLRFIALDKWGETDHLQFASASYPNYALAKDEDPRLLAMGDLLERWATVRTNGAAEEHIVGHSHIVVTGLTAPHGEAVPRTSAPTEDDSDTNVAR